MKCHDWPLVSGSSMELAPPLVTCVVLAVKRGLGTNDWRLVWDKILRVNWIECRHL